MSRPAAEILVAMERECLLVDAALAEKRWSDCDASWRTQRRLTHELEIAVRALPRGTPEAALIDKRIARLVRYREGQLRKLQAFHSGVGKKLATLQKFRSYAKTVTRRQRSSIFDSNA
jgi:hypothetical protein